MNRRKFLCMLGLAPAVGALLGVVRPKLFWAGTTIPRNTPLPFDMWEHVTRMDGRVQAASGINDWSHCGLCDPTYSGGHLCEFHARIIDPLIEQTAKELAYRAGKSMIDVWKWNLDA